MYCVFRHTCELRKDRKIAKNTPWEELGANDREIDPNCEACMVSYVLSIAIVSPALDP